MAVKHPPILWAQSSSNLYLTVEVQNMKIEEMKLYEDSFKIKGTKGDEKYEADLQLYAKLKGEENRKVATDRRIELMIPKETAEWWPHLLKEKTKLPWIKVDFDKWVDEDAETEEEDRGFGGMDFSQFGGADGSNMDGMDFSQFGRGGPENFDDLDMENDEDDNTQDTKESDESEKTEKKGEFEQKEVEIDKLKAKTAEVKSDKVKSEEAKSEGSHKPEEDKKELPKKSKNAKKKKAAHKKA